MSREESIAKAQERLGRPGRMVAWSKSGYSDRNPTNLVVFNANVCLESGKIWHGDIDVTLDEPDLINLARDLGKTIYVLYEMDGRFDNEDDPLIHKHVYKTDGTEGTLGDSISKYFHRIRKKIRLRPEYKR